MLDFSKHYKKDDKDKKTASVHYMKGDYKNMMEEKKKKIPEVLKAIEEVFEDYDGSTVILLVNHTDENGHTEGTHQLVLGVDQPDGIIKIVKAMSETQENIIDLTIKGASDMGGAALMALLSSLLDITKDELKGK